MKSQAFKESKARRRKYEGPTTIAIHLQKSRNAEKEKNYKRAMQHAKAALIAHDSSAEFGKGDVNRHRIIERMGEIFEKINGHYKKNPARRHAPGPAERSAKFHKIRKVMVKDLQAAKRNGNRVREDFMSRKLGKLDRIFYAPRNVKRRRYV